jgi:hypothetical protein
MRRSFAVFLLSFFVTAAVLADVIIDGTPIDGSVIQSISIDPITGNITITSDANTEIIVSVNPIGSNVTIDEFRLAPSSVLINGSTTVEWTVSNATSCTASNGLGGWGGSVSNTGGSQLIADVGSTPDPAVTFTLTCDDGGTPVVANAILTISENPVVTINSFSVSPTSLDTTGAVTVSWNVSEATSCTAQEGFGTWSGSVSANAGNNQQVVNATVSGNYIFTLFCQNATSNDSASSVTISVNEPTGNCTPPTLAGSTVAWEDIRLAAWPFPSFQQDFVGVGQGQYLAVEFFTGSVIASGAVSTIPASITNGNRLITFAPCPGQFTEQPSQCSFQWGLGGTLGWSTDSSADAAFCPLLPNTTYYMNITFTDGVNVSTDTCERIFGSACFTELVTVKIN